MLQDSDSNIKLGAIDLYYRLFGYLSSTDKTKFKKKILPILHNIAIQDENFEVRKKTIDALVTTKDPNSMMLIVNLFCKLSDDDFQSIVTGYAINTIVHSGQGPKFRLELFKLFERSKNETLRKRIEELTKKHYLG